MADDLFNSIVDQLKGMKLNKFCMYLENEPLLDSQFFERCRNIRDSLKFKVRESSTNASTLTSEKAETLADTLEGTSHEIWISFHGISKETYENIMGLDFKKSLANIVNLLKLAERRNLKVFIRGAGSALRNNKKNSPYHFTPREYESFWEGIFRKNDIAKPPRLVYLSYHDRAGSIRRNQYNFEVERTSLLGFYCDRADQWLHVLYNGEIILCCNDYHRRTVIGNLNDQTIVDLLVSPKYREYRKSIMGLKKSPDDFICKHCSKPGG
jgi:hypothetical protein